MQMPVWLRITLDLAMIIVTLMNALAVLWSNRRSSQPQSKPITKKAKSIADRIQEWVIRSLFFAPLVGLVISVVLLCADLYAYSREPLTLFAVFMVALRVAFVFFFLTMLMVIQLITKSPE